ncbi:leucine-rich repeat-containing protein 51-like, partial [Sipha flava]|uniref:Leucine-rich repeat-containing protein 51 n=1 Tax=Sipha flava TaxID=143950 RepID=A0A8B8F990_9HEMI
LNGNGPPLQLSVRGAPKKCRMSKRYKTGSFWLNKNNLEIVNGLRTLADRLFDKADYLSWLDLSHNNLTTISDEFLSFPNMSMLYLHANNIEDIVEVIKMRKLSKLRILTLNKNPMCVACAHYRSIVIYMVPGLQKLDNTVVVGSERNSFKPSMINR